MKRSASFLSVRIPSKRGTVLALGHAARRPSGLERLSPQPWAAVLMPRIATLTASVRPVHFPSGVLTASQSKPHAATRALRKTLLIFNISETLPAALTGRIVFMRRDRLASFSDVEPRRTAQASSARLEPGRAAIRDRVGCPAVPGGNSEEGAPRLIRRPVEDVERNVETPGPRQQLLDAQARTLPCCPTPGD